MDEQPEHDASAEATAPEANTLSDEAAITADPPVDTSESGAADLPQQQQNGEDEIQPPSNDDQAKEAQEPEIVEEAGAGNELAAEEKSGEKEQEEDTKEEGAAVGEGSKTSINPKNPKSAMVVLLLLEGEEKALEKKKKVKAGELIDVAHRDSDVHEGDFFSLFYYDDCERSSDQYTVKIKQKIFVDPTKQVKGQLPSDKQQQPWKLHYGVKFFIPDPAKLKDDQSRFLYCLQLCDDIRNNLVRVDRETAIRLTALMLQGHIGDYDEESHEPGYTNKYPRLILLPKAMQPDNYEAQVVVVHKAKAGYSRTQADQEFLQIAKELPRYGEHQFLAKDQEGHVVTIGNGCKGISIYYHENDDQSDHHIEWRNIVKISYKRRRFKIRFHPKRNDNESEDSAQRSELLKFITGDPPQAKRIWRNAVEQHTFFRLSEPETPSVINTIFRRGTSFRYSGRTYRQIPRDKKSQARPLDDIPRDPTRAFDIKESDVGSGFVILAGPPVGNGIDLEKLEHQKVVVDFRLTEGLTDDTWHYVIQRDKSGSYEVLSTGLIEDDKNTERTYHLSEVDENSKAATTSVSLNIDPPSGIELTTSEQNRGQQKGVTIFDSERMPIVNLGSASMVTTSTVIESEGRRLTTGEHSQQYSLEEVADVHMMNGRAEQWAGPAVDSSEEAKQVDLFLESEHAVMQKAFENDLGDLDGLDGEASPPPQVEVIY